MILWWSHVLLGPSVETERVHYANISVWMSQSPSRCHLVHFRCVISKYVRTASAVSSLVVRCRDCRQRPMCARSLSKVSTIEDFQWILTTECASDFCGEQKLGNGRGSQWRVFEFPDCFVVSAFAQIDHFLCNVRN